MSLYGFCLLHQADVAIDLNRRCLADNSPVIPPSWGAHTQAWRDGRWWPEKARPDGWRWTSSLPTGYVGATEATSFGTPPAVATRTGACRRCGTTFTDARRGGRERIYCSSDCKERVAHARKKPFSPGLDVKATAQRRAPGRTVTITCETCRATVTRKAHGGAPRRYCSMACSERHRAANRAAEVRARLTSTICGRTDCGVAFTPTIHGGTRSRYCSIRCRDTVNSRIKRAKTLGDLGRSCLACGTTEKPHKAKGLCSPCWRRQKRGEVAA